MFGRDRLSSPQQGCTPSAVGRTLGCLLAWSLAVTIPANLCWAQPSPPPEAVDLYLEGRALYQDGRYRESIARLKAALKLDAHSPNLMYNVARVNELLGNLDEAIAYYGRYLDTLERNQRDERADIKATLMRLHGARDEVRAAAQPRKLKDLRVNTEDTPLGKADLAFWLTASAGAGLLLASGVTGWMALQRENDLVAFVLGSPPQGDGPLTAKQSVAREADRLALTADVLLGAGLATVAGAALLYFLRDPEGKTRNSPNHGERKPTFTVSAQVSHRQVGMLLVGPL